MGGDKVVGLLVGVVLLVTVLLVTVLLVGGFAGLAGSLVITVEEEAPPMPPEIEAAYRLVAYRTGVHWAALAAWDAAANGYAIPIPTVDQIFREKVERELERRRRRDQAWCNRHPTDTTRCPPDEPFLTPEEELEIWRQAHRSWRTQLDGSVEEHAARLTPQMAQFEKNPEAVYRTFIGAVAAERAADWFEGYLLLDLAQSDADDHYWTAVQLPPGWQPASGFAWPVVSPITSRYGLRNSPVDGVMRLHAGIDLGAPHGSPVRATKSGRVKAVTTDSIYGIAVQIDHEDGYGSFYAHLSAALVQVGDQVNPGDVVGLVGSTGKSTGPHLHFEIHYQGVPVDPLLLLRDRTERE